MKRAIFSKMSLLLAVCSRAVFSLPLRADVSGFGGTGAGWTTNAFANHPAPPIAADVLTITTSGDTSDSRSAWHNTKQRIDGAWTATFTYTKTARGLDNPGLVYWDADGLTFTFQNAGLNALGQSGGNVGYTNVAPSAGLAIKVYVYNDSGSIDDSSGLGIVSGGQDVSPVAYQNRADGAVRGRVAGQCSAVDAETGFRETAKVRHGIGGVVRACGRGIKFHADAGSHAASALVHEAPVRRGLVALDLLQHGEWSHRRRCAAFPRGDGRVHAHLVADHQRCALGREVDDDAHVLRRNFRVQFGTNAHGVLLPEPFVRGLRRRLCAGGRRIFFPAENRNACEHRRECEDGSEGAWHGAKFVRNRPRASQ